MLKISTPALFKKNLQDSSSSISARRKSRRRSSTKRRPKSALLRRRSRSRRSRSRRSRSHRSLRRRSPRGRSPPRRSRSRRVLLRSKTPRRRSVSAASESSFDSGTGDRHRLKMGIVYWGCGCEGKGWDFMGRGPGGFPRIDRNSDALVDSWKGCMENAQVTLRMCASEGPGFKRYVRHFMMLSGQACVEFRLPQYHKHNTLNRRKVLTERIVIGGILDSYHRGSANTGMRISNGENGFISYLRRRCRRYRAQASKLGGHFAAIILEGARSELKFVAAARAVQMEKHSNLKRLMLILGGPDGISGQVREQMREVLEEYTDFPLFGLALPGGTLHSYYALATVLVFHDQNLLIPFLEVQLGRPSLNQRSSKRRSPERRPSPPKRRSPDPKPSPPRQPAERLIQKPLVLEPPSEPRLELRSEPRPEPLATPISLIPRTSAPEPKVMPTWMPGKPPVPPPLPEALQVIQAKAPPPNGHEGCNGLAAERLALATFKAPPAMPSSGIGWMN